MPGLPFKTSETVAAETRAALAMSLIVADIIEKFPGPLQNKCKPAYLDNTLFTDPQRQF